jgi:Ni/Co efflux regulator RcnB
MNKNAIVCAILAMTLASGGSAFAQGSKDRDDRGRNDNNRGNQNDRRDYDRRDNDNRKGDRQHDDRRDFGRSHNDKNWQRGAGPNHNYYRGQRLPAEYRHRHYVVNDWRGHHLSAPPRGHHWVQSGSDYLLVAIATGVILQLMLVN